MNRIKKLFQAKKNNVLSVYFCAGHPFPVATMSTIEALQKGGVDMIEIGIPFSDPLADGPTIQSAMSEALKNGMTLTALFEQLKDVRSTVSMPIILMSYLNPILHYGYATFCQKCKEVGIDGLIIPDLSFDQYKADYLHTTRKHGIEMVFLVTPETSEERIRAIDASSDSFIYAVSSASLTGVQSEFDERKQAYFERLQKMHLVNPLLVGFGISNLATRQAACAHTAGVVVGSKFVSLLEQHSTPREAVAALIKALNE